MKNIEIAPFYIGQEVVANRNHCQGAFKKGDEFVVVGVTQCPKCNNWKVDVGCPNFYRGTECTVCGAEYGMNSNIRWFKSSSFSPKLEIKDFISMKELAEKQLELISAN